MFFACTLKRASHNFSILQSQKGIKCTFCVLKTTVKLVLSFRAFKKIKLNFYDAFLCYNDSCVIGRLNNLLK